MCRTKDLEVLSVIKRLYKLVPIGLVLPNIMEGYRN